MDGPAERDPRVYFAAERTFLAWVRTGLGLMGVGFAVARFGLFLRQLKDAQGPQAHPTSVSLWSGVGLVVLGVIVTAGALFGHLRIVRELSSGTWQPGKVSKSAIALGILLACFGIGMSLYLLLVH